MKKSLVAVACCLLLTSFAFAQKPAPRVVRTRHPNIVAAQKLCAGAFEKIVAAQKANEFDLKGHAQKAKELLEQANNELKQAAEAANAR